MTAIATSATLQRSYAIDGMTCGSCVARVQKMLEDLPEVERASVNLDNKRVDVTLAMPTAMGYLDHALGERYTLREVSAPVTREASAATAPPTPAAETSAEPERSWLATYRPLLTIVGLIVVTTVLAQAPYATGFDAMVWMRHFMAGFFIVFAGFKLLDVTDFSESYQMYDVVAKRLPMWGLVYPFIELGLGLAYLTNLAPAWASLATILILGISSIGVIQSVMQRRAIKCACLGTGFNLPMTTVTIVEDVSMVAMAMLMLLL